MSRAEVVNKRLELPAQAALRANEVLVGIDPAGTTSRVAGRAGESPAHPYTERGSSDALRFSAMP